MLSATAFAQRKLRELVRIQSQRVMKSGNSAHGKVPRLDLKTSRRKRARSFTRSSNWCWKMSPHWAWGPMTTCGSLCAGETPSRPLDSQIYRLRTKPGQYAARGPRLQACMAGLRDGDVERHRGCAGCADLEAAAAQRASLVRTVYPLVRHVLSSSRRNETSSRTALLPWNRVSNSTLLYMPAGIDAVAFANSWREIATQ